MDTISAALRRLDLSASEQAIYLSLLRSGRATARLLSDRTGLTRPSVYDQLKTLRALNLVVELDIEGKAQFAAAELKHLEALLTDRIDRLEQSREQLAFALPALASGVQTVVPKIRFFEGADGVKQILKDVMWHDHETLSLVWPVAPMNVVFDSAFLRWFDERRQVRSLALSVVVIGNSKSLPFTLVPGDTVKTLTTAKTTMASIIYGSKVAYISSQAEAFGFIVESAEYVKFEQFKFTTL